MTQVYDSLSDLVDTVIEKRGRNIVLALPLGLGKANHIANELTQRALDGELESLTIYSALSLARPKSSTVLESRLMEPIVDRLYGDYPDLLFVDLRSRDALPDNIHIQEFYYPPGSLLGSGTAQRNYLSINYTEAFRIIRNANVDLIAQMVAPTEGGYDLSCNPDISLELISELNDREDGPLVVGQVNRQLPAMGRDATLSTEHFDLVLDDDKYEHPLFSMPSMPPTDAEYAIGLRVASLLKDGGTIQLGIGNLGETVAWAALLRHRESAVFADLVDALQPRSSCRQLIDKDGGTGPFEKGLYASSEMLPEGLLRMFEGGVIKREVADGIAMHAAFFLGSPAFYQTLRDLSDEDRARIAMASVRWTNLLYGDEETKRQQRVDGRFVNEGMMVTLLGAVVSDQLEDGRVVSGVGGQYEFVAMANALEGARSILMISAIRESRGEVSSNIVWNYGHTTIPRHLRDIIITEYGIADLRDKDDEGIVKELIAVADSRFQEELVRQAKAAGKLSADYEVPAEARGNTPDMIEEVLRPWRQEGVIPRCPFDSALTDLELDLVESLRYLRGVVDEASAGRWPTLNLDGLLDAASIPDEAEPYLRRMGLHSPEGAREYALQRVLVYGLAARGLI